MQYHLVMTQKCNLNCTYCGASVEPSIMPVDLNISTLELQEFLKKDPKDVVLAFYGGEPTLNSQKIVEIMDNIPVKAFMLQTNGTILSRLPPSYQKQFHSILISIDGRPKLTDQYRGKNTYKRALAGGLKLRENGFQGDLIARMTVSELSDIFEEVTHLLELEQPNFDHVHWQLDAMWDLDIEDRWSEFHIWVLNSYNPGITQLVQYWKDKMVENNEILGIAPFKGIMYTLLTEKPTGLRCGAGRDFFSITTDGRVTICPILPSVNFAVVGNIQDDDPLDLVDRITLDEPCISCEVREICGGRCVYTNKTKYWGEEGFNLVCTTVKHLISQLRKIKPDIEELLDNGTFQLQDFKYPVIPNGVEIIP